MDCLRWPPKVSSHMEDTGITVINQQAISCFTASFWTDSRTDYLAPHWKGEYKVSRHVLSPSLIKSHVVWKQLLELQMLSKILIILSHHETTGPSSQFQEHLLLRLCLYTLGNKTGCSKCPACCSSALPLENLSNTETWLQRKTHGPLPPETQNATGTSQWGLSYMLIKSPYHP